MELNAITDSFERVAKKQKTSSSKSQELIAQVSHEIEEALNKIQSRSDFTSSIDHNTLLAELKAKLQVANPHTRLDEPQRELNTNLSRFQKALEKRLHPDISKACVDVDFDHHILNQIIICYFYSEGLFDIADCLIRDGGEPEPISLRLQYQEIHQILDALKSKNLDPALKWIDSNQERLNSSGSDLELKLHLLQFVSILQNLGSAEALKYANAYLTPLSTRHMKEIQRLLCSILWEQKLDKSPYSDLIDPLNWEKFAKEIMKTFCNFIGQSIDNPLTVVIAAGVEGLPTLLKLASVMVAKKKEWEEMKQLPVPIELRKEFQFHSIFVCPVSRDQGSKENPPMLLPCGHALCKQSIVKLSKNNSRSFKCPYCPQDASYEECQQLWF